MVILVNEYFYFSQSLELSNKMGNPILKICGSVVYLYLTEQSHKKLTYIFSKIGFLNQIICFDLPL